jgi:hypothetical protein
VLGLDRLEFDGDLLAGNDVDTEVDVPEAVDRVSASCIEKDDKCERATANLAPDAVFAADLAQCQREGAPH